MDVEALLEYTPKLQYIHLIDNNFKCNRLQKILDLLKTKNITARTSTAILRKRDYTPELIENHECLSDSQYESEYGKLSLEQQTLIEPPTTTTENPATSTSNLKI